MSIEPTTNDQSEKIPSSLAEEALLSNEHISDDASQDNPGATESLQTSTEQSSSDSIAGNPEKISPDDAVAGQSEAIQETHSFEEGTLDVQQPVAAEPITNDSSTHEPVAEVVSETAESSKREGQVESGKKKETAPRLPDEVVQPIWDELKKSLIDTEVLQVTCLRTTHGGMVVSYKDLEGFIPRGQFALEGRPEMSEIEQYVGQQVPACVIEISDISKRKFVVSRKKGLRIEKFKSLKKGDVLEGVVTSIVGYGAFVDIGGLDGLVHISRMSKTRIDSPSDVVKVNDKVKVKVVDVDAKKNRISLSMKEFAPSPWIDITERFPVGSVHKGKVRNLQDYAAYVQLEPGVVGMVHISDLSWTQRLDHPSEVVKVGESVEVKVMDIKTDSHRITLSLKDVQPDPWPRLANIYPVNTEVVGKIKSLLDAGIIVALEHDLDAFVPRGRMGGRKKGSKAPDFQIGEEIRLKVIEMNPEKHSIVCALPREETRPSSPRERHETPVQFTTASSTGFTLGELTALKDLFPQEAATETQEETQTVSSPQAIHSGSGKTELGHAETASEIANEVEASTPSTSMQVDLVNDSGETLLGENASSESVESSSEAIATLDETIASPASPVEFTNTSQDEKIIASIPIDDADQPTTIEAVESALEPEIHSDNVQSESALPADPPTDSHEEKS